MTTITTMCGREFPVLKLGERWSCACGCGSSVFAQSDGSAADEIERLTAEVERLRAALDRFGTHDPNCGFYDYRNLACTCGLHAARAYQQLASAPHLIHVGRDGEPHDGPRADCAKCQGE